MTAAGLLLTGTLLVGWFMALVFGIALRLRNFSIVDIAWSANFTPLALLYAGLGTGDLARRTLLAAMVTLWSLRLAWHLLMRIASHHPQEDGRYLQLRQAWADGLKRRFFFFFQFQAALNVVLSVPFVLACVDKRRGLGPFEWAGMALFLVALVGEAMADAQLRAFKAKPAHRGKTCQAGLWRYSRHPNYFFEWLIWCSYFVFVLPSPWGWITLYCPLLMLWFLFRVTGIPMAEAQALRSRGDEYREYQRTTSSFVPWFPRH